MNISTLLERTVAKALVVIALLCAVLFAGLHIAVAQESSLRERIYAQVSADPGSADLTEQELNDIVDALTVKAEDASVEADDVARTASNAATIDLSAGGVVSCFDYYTFGSVQANFDSTVSSAVSGTPVTFTGEILNNNPYPVVDGALYVKVFRLRDDSGAKNVNGPHVVDQYFVKEGINIPANGAVPLSFSWNIPAYAMSGEYQVAAFFTTSKRFNLLGLSFTDDVIGNSARFEVSAERSTGIYFDKDSVKVNSEPYYFAAFPPAVEGAAKVEAYVTNETDDDVRIPVMWRLYSWDAQRRENLITEQETSVTVKAGQRALVAFNTPDAIHSVYLLEGSMRWRDTESFINVRFARDDVDQLRINFPSVAEFPLQEGQSNHLFSCLHNTTVTSVSDGRLELTLLDEDGDVIESYTYSGEVTGDMMGVAKEFVPSKSYDRFTLQARLYQGDRMVDEVSVKYDCEDIQSGSCSLESEDFDFGGLLGGFAGTAAAVILATLLAMGAIWVWWRHEKITEDSTTDSVSQPPLA